MPVHPPFPEDNQPPAPEVTPVVIGLGHAAAHTRMASDVAARGLRYHACATLAEAAEAVADAGAAIALLAIGDDALRAACHRLKSELGTVVVCAAVFEEMPDADTFDALSASGLDEVILAGHLAAHLPFLERHVRERIAVSGRIETVLLGEQSQLQQYLDVAGVMFVVIGKDGVVRSINEKGARLLGYPVAEIIGKDWFDHFVPPEGRAAVRQVFNTLMAGEKPQARYYENPILTASGEQCPMAWNNLVLLDGLGNPIGTLSSGQDVTDQKRVEEALRESDARVRAILETTVDAIITIGERGTIRSFNKAAEGIFGYVASEVIGKNVSVLMPDPYRTEHDGYLRSYLDTGHRKIIGIGREVEGQRKDGSTFPMDLAVSEVKFSEERTFTGIVRDITERRRLEQEILRITEMERRRIGQDLHDGLGQMLTGIGLISRNLARQMQSRGAEDAASVEEIMSLIQEADQQARSLARGLIPVDLDAEGLASALVRLANNAERLFGITCSMDLLGKPTLADATVATHLYRIAQEAVSNAVKHGRATTVRIHLAVGEDRLRLRVHDDGIGFPDVLGEDRGMGVRIMQYRARMIGGFLDIRNGASGGAVINCTLPLRGDRSLAQSDTPADTP